MALALDPKRGRGMSGAADSHLALFEFDSAAGALTFALQLPLPAAGVAEACMRWDGKAAATAGWDGKVRLWSLGKRPCLAAVGRHHSKQGTCLLYDSAQQVLISGGQDCHVAVWPTSPQQVGPD
jgi:WD40 repeat protein